MPSPDHEDYLEYLKSWILQHREEEDVVSALTLYAEAVQVLMILDLGPARSVLERCYSPRRRGSEPYDALSILRFFLLGVLINKVAINGLVPLVRNSRVLRAICGFREHGDGKLKSPAVGTSYDLLHRLHDGPLRFVDGAVPPSALERAHAQTPRLVPRKEEVVEPDDKEGKTKKKNKKLRSPPKQKGTEQVTEVLRKTLGTLMQQELPDDLSTRLLEILDGVAIQVSAGKGLLGDVTQLLIAGDGSPLETHANGHGKKVKSCTHGKFAHCDCPRTFADPDATSGWDSYRKKFFFGHVFYEFISVGTTTELPMLISLAPAGTNDQISLMEGLAMWKRYHQRRNPRFSISALILDKGHDGEPLARFTYEDMGVSHIIPIGGGVPAVHPTRKDLKLAPDNAIPLCEAKVKMASWGTAGEGTTSFICPVKAGKLEKCPLAPAEDPDWLCKPDQKYGPTVVLNAHDNPRLFPPVARNSKKFSILYNLRSACERSNAYKKGPGHLAECGHRRASFWKIRLHIIALVQHARAWVAGKDAKAFVAELLLPPSVSAAA